MSPQLKDRLAALLWAALSAGIVAFLTALVDGLTHLDLPTTTQAASALTGAIAAYVRLLPTSA